MSNNEMITLTYDLHSLPTAQHKAGLAGLVMMIESMERRGIEPRPHIVEVTPHGATFTFTREELQALFEDFYDAESIDDKCIPKGKFLFYYDKSPWVKMWREVLWKTLRSKDKQRLNYKARMNNSSVSDVAKYNKLFDGKTKTNNSLRTEEIKSTTFIGYEEHNAEIVKFKGSLVQSLLLYFWILVSFYYVPRAIRIKRKQGKLSFKLVEKGYLLIIPEPLNLSYFLDDVKKFYSKLETKMNGNYPEAALIDYLHEGGLEYIYQITLHRFKENNYDDSVESVELCHLEKSGRSTKILSIDRLVPERAALESYTNLRRKFSNPIYKTMRIRNLLSDKPWFAGAVDLFRTWPSEIFVRKPDDPPISFFPFGGDVRKKFKDIEEDQKTKGGDTLTDQTDDILALHIYRLIRAYVNHKTASKTGISYDGFKDNKDGEGKVIYPREYNEAKSKVCMDVFLSMRGRREQHFIEYFTGTICSVPQWLSEADYMAVSQALICEWGKVKTLSMLALSAHAYNGRNI